MKSLIFALSLIVVASAQCDTAAFGTCVTMLGTASASADSISSFCTGSCPATIEACSSLAGEATTNLVGLLCDNDCYADVLTCSADVAANPQGFCSSSACAPANFNGCSDEIPGIAGVRTSIQTACGGGNQPGPTGDGPTGGDGGSGGATPVYTIVSLISAVIFAGVAVIFH